ncbi:IS1/IS1595 family N-terminal zinc-binding domain-containing protein [Arcanobacterium canis]
MRTYSLRASKCPICHAPMKKNGKNPSGTRRWYCSQCRCSSTRRRNEKKHVSQSSKGSSPTSQTLLLYV